MLAKPGFGKLHAAFEWLGIDQVRMRKIAQFELVAPAQAIAFLGMVFHQDTAGTRVTDIQHHINLDRLLLFIVTVVPQQLDFRYLRLAADQGKQVQVMAELTELFDFGLDHPQDPGLGVHPPDR